jgi:23S rRNA (uracil1939-C5)-methyltransferase
MPVDPSPPSSGVELDVRIEKIVVGGDGLARHEGRVVFVPGTAPGERHRVRVVREKKDFARARSVELLEASSSRRIPPCPYYESCGGCALMHLLPEAQLEAKKAMLAEGLARTGTRPRAEIGLLSAEEIGYRNRLRFHVAVSGTRPIAGFRRRGSHEVVDVESCLLGSRTLNEAWRRVRRTLADRRPFARSLLAVELVESSHEPGRIAGRFVVSSTDGLRALDEPRREELRSAIGLEGLSGAVAGGGPLVRTGRTFVEHRVGELVLRQSMGSFFQANRFLLGKLVAAVVPEAGPMAPPRGLDLYCGVGLFALPLAQRVGSVVGVESETLALRDARENAARAGLGNVRFVRSDAAEYAARARLREEDVVVLDPPRGGLPPELVEAIGRSPLRSIRYVSCDPPALFRDSARLARHGFEIESATLVDLFPNTHHFETVARFSRARRHST